MDIEYRNIFESITKKDEKIAIYIILYDLIKKEQDIYFNYESNTNIYNTNEYNNSNKKNNITKLKNCIIRKNYMNIVIDKFDNKELLNNNNNNNNYNNYYNNIELNEFQNNNDTDKEFRMPKFIKTISKSDFMLLIEKNKNYISFHHLKNYIDIGKKLLNNYNVIKFETFCVYIYNKISYLSINIINIYKYRKLIYDFIDLFNYLYYTYIQILLNFLRIDLEYYYSIKKGRFNKYNIKRYTIDTYLDILKNQISYIEKFIYAYIDFCNKYLSKWVDLVSYKIDIYNNDIMNKIQKSNDICCFNNIYYYYYKCIRKIGLLQSKTKFMYNNITNIEKYINEYHLLIHVLFMESDLTLYIENKNYLKNILFYNKNSSNLDYIINDNDINNLNKKDIFKMYFEILSQLQPKFIENEIDDFLDSGNQYILNKDMDRPALNRNEILYKNFIEMEDLEDTIDYLYYRQLMGYRQMKDNN